MPARRELSACDVAVALLSDLRHTVERDVEEHPERYTGLAADQLPGR
jgi:hypothetical protein